MKNKKEQSAFELYLAQQEHTDSVIDEHIKNLNEN